MSCVRGQVKLAPDVSEYLFRRPSPPGVHILQALSDALHDAGFLRFFVLAEQTHTRGDFVRRRFFSVMRSTRSVRAAPRARIVPKFGNSDLFSRQLPTQLPSHSYSERAAERV